MNRHTSLALTGAFSAIVLLAANGKSYAQESDIKTAINAYHAAIKSLDMSKLDPLWAHDATVILINPRDKSISVGWDAVKKQWEAAFASLAELKDTRRMDLISRLKAMWRGRRAW